MPISTLNPLCFKKAGFYGEDAASPRVQPFPAGAGGCGNFRIPALIRLSDGALFAVSDARWDNARWDAGGIDTIFSISEDGGASWRVGYAALFPDSLGTPANLPDATICIDPAALEDGRGRIHIMVDMFPTGRAPGIASEQLAGAGFAEADGKQRLMLTDSWTQAFEPPEDYAYYAGDPSDGFAPVCRRGGGRTDWALDQYFNIYRKTKTGFEPLTQKRVDSDDMVQQNVFYRDSALHVYNTGYVLHLVSADRARTWRAELIPGALKRPDERGLVVSPGRGLRMAGGRLVFPFYGSTGDTARVCLLWSDDDGDTWRRSADMPLTKDIRWHSESEAVELEGGRLRMFFRNSLQRICWADALPAADGGYEWREPVVSGVAVHSDCNLSAIGLDDRILVAYAEGEGPTNSGRLRGTIYVFDRDMRLEKRVCVEPGSFSYPSLCRVNADTVGVLFDTCDEGRETLVTVPVSALV